MTTNLVPQETRQAYGLSENAQFTPLAGGLINQTILAVDGAKKLVLQKINPIFRPEVHLDIAAITAHLQSTGVNTPLLIPTQAGKLYVVTSENQVWRALTFIAGRVVDQVPQASVAFVAGSLIARFHQAVSTLKHTFHFSRPGAHDTLAHLARLERALQDHAAHRNFARVEPVAQDILRQARGLSPLAGLPTRIIHGDLKISNLMFNETLTQGVAILDLDTMGHLTLPVELGDAMRSWCNPAGEDAGEVVFNAQFFEAALQGYAVHGRAFLQPVERDLLVTGTETIALELSARFCADALQESYFGWNPKKFGSRSDHNLVRASAQLKLAQSIQSQKATLERLVASAWANKS